MPFLAWWPRGTTLIQRGSKVEDGAGFVFAQSALLRFLAKSVFGEIITVCWLFDRKIKFKILN